MFHHAYIQYILMTTSLSLRFQGSPLRVQLSFLDHQINYHCFNLIVTQLPVLPALAIYSHLNPTIILCNSNPHCLAPLVSFFASFNIPIHVSMCSICHLIACFLILSCSCTYAQTSIATSNNESNEKKMN